MGFDNLSAENSAARREKAEQERRRRYNEAVDRHFNDIKANRFKPQLQASIYPDFLNNADRLPAKVYPETGEAQLQQLLNSNNVSAFEKILGKKWPAIRNSYLNQSKAEYWAWIQQLCKTFVLFKKQAAILQFVKAHPELWQLSACEGQEAFYNSLIQFMQDYLKSDAFYQDVKRLGDFFPASCKDEAPLSNNNNDETALPDTVSHTTYPSHGMLMQYLVELFQEEINAEEQKKTKIEKGHYEWLPGTCYAIHRDVQSACSDLQIHLRRQEYLTEQLNKEVLEFQTKASSKEEMDTEKNIKTLERLLLHVLSCYQDAVKASDYQSQAKWSQWIKCLVGYGYSPFNLLAKTTQSRLEATPPNILTDKNNAAKVNHHSSSTFTSVSAALQNEKFVNVEEVIKSLDWGILELCLRYLDPVTHLSEALRDKLYHFCADSKDQVNKWYRRMWINDTIKETRREDVINFLVTFYKEHNDVNALDIKLLRTIDTRKAIAPKVKSSDLYKGLEEVVTKRQNLALVSPRNPEIEMPNRNRFFHKSTKNCDNNTQPAATAGFGT